MSEYFLLGSLSLSSDVDLPVEGLFAFSSGRLIVRISRPGSSMAFLMRFSDWWIRLFGILFYGSNWLIFLIVAGCGLVGSFT